MLRPYIVCALLGVCYLSCGQSPKTSGLLSGNDSRDLIIVSVDTLRASRLPFYESLHREPRLATAGNPETPFSIAWLASQGVVYESAFTTAGKTLPSLASFFTGLDPIEHGAVSNMTRLQADTYTLALRQAGFKNHAMVANRALHKFCGLAAGFDSYAIRAKQLEGELGKDLLSASRADINSGQRVMMWAHFMAPHQPYEPLPQYREQLSIPSEILAGNDALKEAHRSPESQQPFFEAYRDLYDAEVATANQYVQEFLTGLDAEYRAAGRGALLDNAIIVFFSDHGEELADRHGYFLHAKSLYSSVVQVPLIIIDKHAESKQQRVSELVNLSKTLSSVMYGSELTAEYVVSAWHNDYFSIRDQRYTLVHNPHSNLQGPSEPPVDVSYFYPAVALFDRDSDPFELNDIAAQHPQIVARLGSKLSEWYINSTQVDGEATDFLDEQTLAELGYAGDPEDYQDLEIEGPWPAQLYTNE
ncbi:MAG: hypothetical protein ACI84O_000104 [Myxococcota bacterium]|jgi:hypothetical protein